MRSLHIQRTRRFSEDGNIPSIAAEASDIVLYDGTRMSVGATNDEEFDRIVREGGRKRRSTCACARCAKSTQTAFVKNSPI
jgi:hypothetical protein